MVNQQTLWRRKQVPSTRIKTSVSHPESMDLNKIIIIILYLDEKYT